MTSLFERIPAPRHVLPLDFMRSEERSLALLEFSSATLEASLSDEALPSEDGIEQSDYQAQSPPSAELGADTDFGIRLDKARLDAIAETTLSLEHDLQLRLEQERARIATVCTDFVGERQQYFAAAEAEVVRLALAIASRVLAREVSHDAMHLTDTIKAALTKIRDGSKTRLCVRKEESADWVRVFRGEAQLEVVVDPRLAEGECVLETKVGSIALGVRAQMAEIERSFSEWLGESSQEEAAPC